MCNILTDSYGGYKVMFNIAILFYYILVFVELLHF